VVDIVTYEGGCSGVPRQASSCRKGIFRREEMVEGGFVDRYRVCGAQEGRELRGYFGGYKLLGRPYVVRCRPGEEVPPVGGLSFLDGFKVHQQK